ncbi:MAG: hypothetical protein AAF802_19330 [Planctomycetota bacterium]
MSRTRPAAIWSWILTAVFLGSCGCTQLPEMPTFKSLDLMSPSSNILFPGQKNRSPYRMVDGTAPAFSGENSMNMEVYQRIREAKNQNAVVLQVAGDSEPIRVLPLPPGEKSAFVSELLEQTGVRSKIGGLQATVFRPSPESPTGVRMVVRFNDAGEIDPATDYELRAGDRVQITQKKIGGVESLVNLVMRR